ncbi:MAG: hypothetical protein JXR60_07495 [Bacteroidales bacterium]|nr:hypothetical protein [Bacteroidales bacterium]
MSKLIFTIPYADKKWPEYIEENFGKAVADSCIIESMANASVHEAKIQKLNFDNNSSTIDKVVKHANVRAAYIIDQKKVVKKLK